MITMECKVVTPQLHRINVGRDVDGNEGRNTQEYVAIKEGTDRNNRQRCTKRLIEITT